MNKFKFQQKNQSRKKKDPVLWISLKADNLMGKEGWEGHMPVPVVQKGVNKKCSDLTLCEDRRECKQQGGKIS